MIVISLLFLTWGIVKTRGTAVLEIKLLVYDNSAKDQYDGSCCDPFCGACDHFFTIKIYQSTRARNTNLFSRTSRHFQDQNRNVFGADIGGIANPIRIPLASWKGSVIFDMKVEDKDLNFDDVVDYLKRELRLTAKSSVTTAMWTNFVVVGNRRSSPTRLDLSARVYCENRYFGPQCSTFCIPQDTDISGHYTCNPVTGEKVCRPGWKNPASNCRDRINPCLDNNCQHGSICVDLPDSYRCECPEGFQGQHCETIVTESTSQRISPSSAPTTFIPLTSVLALSLLPRTLAVLSI